MATIIELYLPLAICVLFPIVASVVLCLAEEKTAFAKLPYAARQIIIGAVFGIIAIAATEHGVDVNGATANTRDAAPLCAGLIFGGPAGIIAGVIGGIQRWFSVSAGEYSRLACSVSTVLAGLYAAGLRKFILGGKKPTFLVALATGLVSEVFHITLLFITHLTSPEQAFEIVKIVALPMIIANSAALFVSVMITSAITDGVAFRRKKKKTLTQLFQTPMLIAIILAYLASTTFVYFIQTYSARENIENVIELNIEDVKNNITLASDESFLQLARIIVKEAETALLSDGANADESFRALANKYGVADIWYIDRDGIIKHSTDGTNGFDMASDADKPEEERQSSAFLCLLDGDCREYVQELRALAASGEKRKIGGISIAAGGFIQVGMNEAQFRKNLAGNIGDTAKNRHIGQSGQIIITDSEGSIVSVSDTLGGDIISDGAFEAIDAEPEKLTEIKDEQLFVMRSEKEGYTITAIVPTKEAYSNRDTMTYLNSFIETLVFAALFILIFIIIRRVVVSNIHRANEGLNKIIGGDLGTKIDIYTSEEFSSLSGDINQTVDTLKQYIADAESRIDMELKFAKEIQHSALPSTFPETEKFGIYATMDTAKEVGGDFYDFYMPDESHVVFLVADVSGKGIPAAMFMMTAKTMLKNLTETGLPVNEVFTAANNKLCEGNDAAMFVTAWMGILDINTGELNFANAGHNPPLLYRKGGEYSYLKSPAGFVLAGIEDTQYRLQTVTLNRGDRIFLYTDGVTEATDTENALYGEERLLNLLNSLGKVTEKDALIKIREDIDSFAKGAEQADDITMLMLGFNGDRKEEVTLLNVREYPASDESFPPAAEFIEQLLDGAGASDKTKMQLSVSFEEMFINVAHYAYPKGDEGVIRLEAGVEDDEFVIIITDRGIPFDPFAREDPDVAAAAEDKKIGGLGIYMTKQFTDSAEYRHEDGCNIVTLRKKLP